MKRTLIALFFFSVCHSQAAKEKPSMVAVKAGRLIDVVNGKVLEKQVILIEGERIKAVAADGSVQIPAGATVIDLSDATVMPGFIDCHTHIVSQIERYDDRFRDSPIDAAVSAHVFAKRTLEAGFTTCRDVGSGEFIDVALKKAINEGKIAGPRLFVAGHGLSVTGGHGDLSGYSPYLKFE
ncbi:MAG: amidohydrolase family protein, partial [Ignavibacteriales bacterium]|nr:amidohydrolase family protein [Ignavibacteriales bacterium]